MTEYRYTFVATKVEPVWTEKRTPPTRISIRETAQDTAVRHARQRLPEGEWTIELVSVYESTPEEGDE